MTTATSADQVIQAATNLAPLIREYSDEAEQNLRLSTPVVDALTDAGVFRYLVPQSLGGGEGDPPGFYRMVEELGRVDGSTGWCGYVGSGGSFIGPNLSDEAAQPIWSDPRAVLAGGVFPFQPIVREAGGYRVNGQWSYVSGSTHATYLMASCILPSDESPGNEAQADPNLGFVVVPRDAAESPDTWDVLGLNGTGSHDVAIRSILVSELFTAQFRPGGPKGSHYQGQLYRFPFTGFFAQPMGAVALGIAQGAIDSVIDVAQSKVPVGGGQSTLNERPLFHLQIAEAVAAASSARTWLYQVVQENWELAQAGEVPLAARNLLALAAAHATKSARQAIEVMYLAAGGSANYNKSPLPRAGRDIHALTQHVATSPQQFPNAGRILAGLEPDSPFIFL